MPDYENDEMPRVDNTAYEVPLRGVTTFEMDTSSHDMATYQPLSLDTLEEKDPIYENQSRQ